MACRIDIGIAGTDLLWRAVVWKSNNLFSTAAVFPHSPAILPVPQYAKCKKSQAKQLSNWRAVLNEKSASTEMGESGREAKELIIRLKIAQTQASRLRKDKRCSPPPACRSAAHASNQVLRSLHPSAPSGAQCANCVAVLADTCVWWLVMCG